VVAGGCTPKMNSGRLLVDQGIATNLTRDSQEPLLRTLGEIVCRFRIQEICQGNGDQRARYRVPVYVLVPAGLAIARRAARFRRARTPPPLDTASW
jgi:hypothetical protein